MPHILIIIIVGAIAGWLAGVIVDSDSQSFLLDVLIGIVGGYIGYRLFGNMLNFTGYYYINLTITSTAGAVILNYYHNGLVPPTQPYGFNYGRINFAWNVPNKSLKLSGFSSQNGGSSGWITDIIYNYTVTDAGVFKFTLNTAASGGYVAVPLSKLDAFLLTNTVTFDYYVDNGNLYGKMTSVEDPSIVMTFLLQ